MKRCIEVAQLCVDDDQHKRPTVNAVIKLLSVKETEVQMVPLVLGQTRNRSSSSVQQASIFPVKLLDKVHSMAVSEALSHSQLQQTISVPKGPGEKSSTEGSSVYKVADDVESVAVSTATSLQLQQQQVFSTQRGQGEQSTDDQPTFPSRPQSPLQQITGSTPISERHGDTRSSEASSVSMSAGDVQSAAVFPSALSKQQQQQQTKESGGQSVEGSSFVHELVDEAQSNSGSGPSSPLQQTTAARKGQRETSTEISKLLDVYPLELCFPFEPNKIIRLAVTLTNRTDDYVCVWITLNDYSNPCLGFHFPVMCGNESFKDTCSCFCEMIDPHSTLAVPMTMKEQGGLPKWDRGRFEVLMIAMKQKEHLENLKASNVDSDLQKRAEELGGMVHRVILAAAIRDQTSCHAVIDNHKKKVTVVRITKVSATRGIGPSREAQIQRPRPAAAASSLQYHQSTHPLGVREEDHRVANKVVRFMDPEYSSLPQNLYPEHEVAPGIGGRGRVEGQRGSEVLSTTSHGRSSGAGISSEIAQPGYGRGGQMLGHAQTHGKGRVGVADAGYWRRRRNEVGPRYGRQGEAARTTFVGTSSGGRGWRGGSEGRVFLPPRRSSRLRAVRLVVLSAKFVAREHWLVTGDDEGRVHVYDYTTMDKVVEFEAHRERLDLLSVHPTCQLLLTASSFVGSSIKLWDWEKAWICTRTFDVPSTRLFHLSWDPWDTNGFASVSKNHDTLKLWNIESSDPVTTMEGMKGAGCLYYADNQRRITVTTSHLQNNDGKRAFIWDLQTKECVHRLGMNDWDIYDIACHPTLPILATSHLRGSILCLWDTRTYRLQAIIQLQDSHIPGKIFFSNTEELIRVVIECWEGISTMEINLKTIWTDLDTEGGN